MQPLFLSLALLLFALGASSGETACLVTLPPSPAFIPPAPYDQLPVPEGGFWYGTDALWTQLDADGVWHTKDNVDKHGGYVTKLIFWTQDFKWRKENEPELIVTAQRLDGDAPSVAVAYANAVNVTGKTPAVMTGIRVPTSGCWEVTGYYRGHRLTFVVSVEP